ncbi:hypothetical protein I0P07_002350 [Staphylococcus pseudintermedius]|nr:hypothetical protein [Staphylococcus pseudintermedius]ELK4619682.1 hypothetical protein [Staphylococcus pseudintermedius]MCE5445925.1 hypothetical protein [Staphylococcus pseudintermedius]HCT0500858.1 hypothetical protein [Staphylococcus pseudintermedius]
MYYEIVITQITRNKLIERGNVLAHYSVRITRDKSFKKLKDKELEAIKEEAIESVYELIKKHIIAHNLSKDGGNSTVIEFDIDVNTPPVTRDKEYTTTIELL